MTRTTILEPKTGGSARSRAVVIAADSWIEREGLLRGLEASTSPTNVLDLRDPDWAPPGNGKAAIDFTVLVAASALDRLQRAACWTTLRDSRTCSWVVACNGMDESQRIARTLASVMGGVTCVADAAALIAALSRNQTPEDPLTPRQRQVLSMVRGGLSNKAIAAHLGVAIGTVKNHVSALLRRFGAGNRTQIATARTEPLDRSHAPGTRVPRSHRR